jgi:hypothetical protein
MTSVVPAPATAAAAGPAGAGQPVKPHSKRRDKDDSNNIELGVPQIGNYVFVKTLGEGNFAKVKLARHKLTGQEVGWPEKTRQLYEPSDLGHRPSGGHQNHRQDFS